VTESVPERLRAEVARPRVEGGQEPIRLRSARPLSRQQNSKELCPFGRKAESEKAQSPAAAQAARRLIHAFPNGGSSNVCPVERRFRRSKQKRNSRCRSAKQFSPPIDMRFMIATATRPRSAPGDLLFVSGQVGSREDGSPEPVFEDQVRRACQPARRLGSGRMHIRRCGRRHHLPHRSRGAARDRDGRPALGDRRSALSELDCGGRELARRIRFRTRGHRSHPSSGVVQCRLRHKGVPGA
jgi:enamine deaminase RidA (YjgF/YER057c/UK114 family)